MLLLEFYQPHQTLIFVDDYIKKNVTSEKVHKWFYEESQDITNLNCKPNNGHVRYAFILSMYFLRNSHISYEEAIYQTLLKGGDTDTNAAIVGGLVATYSKIPNYMLKPVLDFDCSNDNFINKKGHKRPIQYSVIHTFKDMI
jgi:ADP-ribosylglycohydrolase